MSSSVIPKEQLTAFERWELPSFDHGGSSKNQKQSGPATVAVLEQIRQQAHDEGQLQGRELGYAAGIQQAQGEATQIHGLLENIQIALNQLDEQVAQSLLDLSLQIARKMVDETLRIQPEVILKIVSEAIGNLPHFNQNAHLILHPDDAELVRKHMGEQLSHSGWKIFSDAKIQRGGCRVETSSSQIDGSVETRWQRIVESIGQDTTWLA